MNIESFVKNNSVTRNSSAHPSSHDGSAPKFEHLLEWVRLGSAHARKNLTCADKHRQNLSALVETENRLSEFDHWRESLAFTEPEKAALTLSEIISLHEPEKLSPRIIGDARRHFSTEEILCLTLTIMFPAASLVRLPLASKVGAMPVAGGTTMLYLLVEALPGPPPMQTRFAEEQLQ